MLVSPFIRSKVRYIICKLANLLRNKDKLAQLASNKVQTLASRQLLVHFLVPPVKRLANNSLARSSLSVLSFLSRDLATSEDDRPSRVPISQSVGRSIYLSKRSAWRPPSQSRRSRRRGIKIGQLQFWGLTTTTKTKTAQQAS